MKTLFCFTGTMVAVLSLYNYGFYHDSGLIDEDDPKGSKINRLIFSQMIYWTLNAIYSATVQ